MLVGCGSSNRPAPPAARDAAATPVVREDPLPTPTAPDAIVLWRARDAAALRTIATTSGASAAERYAAALLLHDLEPTPALLYELFADRSLLLPLDEGLGEPCADDARCRQALDAAPVFELAEVGKDDAILAVIHAADHGDGAVADVLCSELLQLAAVQPRRLLAQIAALDEGDPRNEACGRVAFCIGPDRGTPAEVKQRIALLARPRVPPAAARVRDRILTQVRAELAVDDAD